MSELPPNPQALAADKLIKAIESILVPIAENAIIAAVPELGLPVVKQITQAIEQGLSDKLTKLAETGVTFGIIDHQTDNENSAINDARVELRAAIQSGDTNAIQQALSDFQKAQSGLVNDDGSTPAQ